MKIKSCLIFVLLITARSFAQDTLFLRDNNVIIVSVKEINTTEVKYKKYGFENGPLYIQNQSEIRSIHYKNGALDEFKMEAPAPVFDYVTAPVQEQVREDQKILILGNNFEYRGKRLNEKALHRMIYATNDPTSIELVRKAKSAKAIQYIGFLAFPTGIAACFFAELGSEQAFNPSTGTYGSNSRQNLYYICAGTFAAIAISCPIESAISKTKRNRCNEQAAERYNLRFQ